MITMMQNELPRNNKPSYLAASLNTGMQTVEFDPSNAEHRKAYADFIKHKKWTIRFTPQWPMSAEMTAVTRLAKMACVSEWN